MLKLTRNVIHLPADNNKRLPKDHPGLWVSTGIQFSSKQGIWFSLCSLLWSARAMLAFFSPRFKQDDLLSGLTTSQQTHKNCWWWRKAMWEVIFFYLPMNKHTGGCRAVSCALKPQAGRCRVPFGNQNNVWGRHCGNSFNTARFHAQQEEGLKIEQDANEGLAHTICTMRWWFFLKMQ